MIYLFDDNEFGQMSKNYSYDVVEEIKNYNHIIKHYEIFPVKNTVENIIKDAKMVFIHNSFPPLETNFKICYLSEKMNLPLVVFSGGDTLTIWDNKNEKIVRKMKKDRFYHNLLPFLQFYEKNPDSTDLKKLIYGNNYEIARSNIILDSLSKTLVNNLKSYNYESLFIGGSKPYKDLSELFYFLYPEDYEKEFNLFDEKILVKNLNAKELYLEIYNIVKKIKQKYDE